MISYLSEVNDLESNHNNLTRHEIENTKKYHNSGWRYFHGYYRGSTYENTGVGD
jgi:hypothetical protein